LLFFFLFLSLDALLRVPLCGVEGEGEGAGEGAWARGSEVATGCTLIYVKFIKILLFCKTLRKSVRTMVIHIEVGDCDWAVVWALSTAHRIDH